MRPLFMVSGAGELIPTGHPFQLQHRVCLDCKLCACEGSQRLIPERRSGVRLSSRAA